VDLTATQPPRESETAVTGNAWIGQPRSPLGSQERVSRVTRGFDSPTSNLGSQKLLSRVTRGFDSPHIPLGRQERVSRVTRGFNSPHSPYGVSNFCHG